MDKKFLKLYNEYKDKITDADIKREFDMLYSISQDSNVFLVTVVGNVNAGKSTVFNCLVHKEVSQTDSGENTVRPTFVFNSKKDIYNTYSSEDNQPIDINKVLKYFFEPDERIISDCLRVQKLSFEDTKKNQNGDFLFTSYGFDLNIKEANDSRIVFVDMPGNDGLKAERKDHSFYQLILKRTDLVILVCSSPEDISITMKKYIEEIRDYNSVVPFVIVLNDKNSKNDFEGDGDDCNKKLIENITRLRESQVNVDEKQSSIINAYHVSAKILEHKTPKEGSLDKVNKSCDDFEMFKKQIIDTYFNKNQIKEKIKNNSESRFNNQKNLFCDFLGDHITILQSECDLFDKRTEKLEKINTEELKQEIRNAFKDEDGNDKNDPDFSECLNNNGNVRWFRPNVRKILKDKYFKCYLKKSIENFANNQIANYRIKLSENLSKSDWVGKIDFTDEVSQFEQSELKNNIYNDCIVGTLRYNKDSIADSMLNLRTKLYSYENIGEHITVQCNILRTNWINKIKVFEKIIDKENLLKKLKELKNHLSK